MRLSSIMTAGPHCVRPETTLDDALTAMDAGYVRHLPVVSEAGRLVGLISDRDVLQATGWLPSEREPEVGDAGRWRKRPATVAEIMARDVVSASPDETVVAGAVDLAGRRIGCLPIVKDHILVGIVSEMDVLGAFVRHAADLLPGETSNPHVEHLMTWHPTTTAPETTLAEARRLMRQNDIRHLPVVQGSMLAGMLSDRDLRRAYGAGRSHDTEVEEVMTRKVISLTTEATARDAAAALVRQRISALPILAAMPAVTLVGIVTVSNLLELCFSALRDEGSLTPSV
jgi:CBS domain-containing membrane protein